MLNDLVDSVRKELKDYWRLEAALKHGYMEDVEGAIEEAIVRGIAYGAMDSDLVREALALCEKWDVETDNV